ncbi:MAG TPA: hypothetical protein VGF48_24585 [Thermoanaerobaculia bacterium]
MRRSILLLCLVAAVATACRRGESPAAQQPASTNTVTTTAVTPSNAEGKAVTTTIALRPDVLSRSALGSRLAGDGTVIESRETFRRRDPIYLSMWLEEAPQGLAMSARWLDAKGEEVSKQQQPAAGKKFVTFKLDRQLAAGKYKVEGIWGGNVVVEYEFEVQ